MSSVIRHRIGDSFSRRMTWRVGGVGVDLTGYTLSCAIVTDAGNAAVSTATCTPDADQTTNPGVFVCEVADTSAWVPGTRLAFFVRFTSPGGIRKSSPTVLIDPIEDAP